MIPELRPVVIHSTIMRIPWYIVTVLALSVIGLCAWLAIRDADFTNPPSADKVEKAVSDWQVSYPELPEKPKLTQRKVVNIPNTSTPVAKAPKAPKIPTGNLGLSPALSHFTEHNSFEAASFIQLAKQLAKNPGFKNFSTLAWERAIDTGKPNTTEQQEAEQVLQRLKQNQTTWWADHSESLAIDLHIAIPIDRISDKEALSAQILDTIREASSHLITPNIVWRLDDEAQQLWLKPPTQSGNISPKTAIQIPVSIKPVEPGHASSTLHPRFTEDAIYSAIYQSIASTLRFSASPEPPQPSTLSPKEALHTGITRLHWQAFAFMLHNIPHMTQAKAP